MDGLAREAKGCAEFRDRHRRISVEPSKAAIAQGKDRAGHAVGLRKFGGDAPKRCFVFRADFSHAAWPAG